MRTLWPTIFVLLAALAPAGAVAQDENIIVRGSTARIEIERILALDNLDTGQLSPREVAETMEAIPRGRAPGDFWLAYQAHVQAWRRLTNATERARQMLSEPASLETAGQTELVKAELAIESSFDEVERVVGRYGVRMPLPRATTVAAR